MERSFIRLTTGQLLNLRDVKIIDKSTIKNVDTGWTKEQFTICYAFDVAWENYMQEIFDSEKDRDKVFEEMFENLRTDGKEKKEVFKTGNKHIRS